MAITRKTVFCGLGNEDARTRTIDRARVCDVAPRHHKQVEQIGRSKPPDRRGKAPSYSIIFFVGYGELKEI